MTTEHLLDPELLPILQQMPAFHFTRENLPKFRRAGAAAATLGDAEAAGVQRESITISGANWDVPCLLYTPKAGKAEAAYLHIHGGGYVAGQMERSDPMNTLIASQLGITVLAVGYRLAPEHPVPAPLMIVIRRWPGCTMRRNDWGSIESASPLAARAPAAACSSAGDSCAGCRGLCGLSPTSDLSHARQSDRFRVCARGSLGWRIRMDSSEQCIRLVLLSRRSPTGGALCAGKSGQCRRSAFYMDVHCFFGPVS